MSAKGFTISVPGFDFNDVDRNACVAVDRLLRLDIECSRLILIPYQQEDVQNDMTEYIEVLKQLNSAPFSSHITTYMCDIQPGFYDMNHLHHGLKYTSKLTNITDNSYALINVCWSEEINQVLYKSTMCCLNISTETKQPSLIPEELRQKMKHHEVSSYVGKTKQLIRPSSAYSSPRSVHWSESDSSGRVTNSSYIQLCHDAVIEANLHGDQKGKDLGFLKVEKLSCSFQGESHAGDVLNIYAWEDAGQPLLMHSTVEKNQQPLCQCSIQFEEIPHHKL